MRQSEVLSLMRENVAYKLQHGKAKEAVDMLEKLHKYVRRSSLRLQFCVHVVQCKGSERSFRVNQWQMFQSS